MRWPDRPLLRQGMGTLRFTDAWWVGCVFFLKPNLWYRALRLEAFDAIESLRAVQALLFGNRGAR